MENKAELWKASVNKAFYGFLTYTLLTGVVGAIIALVSGAAALASLASGEGAGGFLGPIIVGILGLLGYIYYFLGIKGMRDSTVGTQMEDGTAKIYRGALFGLVGTILDIIPFLGIVGLIFNIIGFVFMMQGFGILRKLPIDELAAKGAQQLWTMMLVSLIGIVLAFIPFLGIICSVVVLVYAFMGWRNFSNSELY